MSAEWAEGRLIGSGLRPIVPVDLELKATVLGGTLPVEIAVLIEIELYTERLPG